MASRIATLFRSMIVIAAGAPVAFAQPRGGAGAIDGVVTDTNLVSLADATVSILGSNIRVVTGANGRFRIVGVPAAEYIFVVHHVGYRPASATMRVGEVDTLRPAFT